MTTRSKPVPAAAADKASRRRCGESAAADRPLPEQLAQALAALRRRARKATRDGYARYALPPDKALGVAMGDIQALAKQLGRKHELALALWATDIYEARLLVAYVADATQLTSAQMDRCCRDFDNWGLCDTLCFALFDRSPLAWRKIDSWSQRSGEFQKRAAFALLASLALHDKRSDDQPFLHGLALIEAAAGDDRNFVRKAVNWALRGIGGRNAALHAAAVALARRLAASEDRTRRWVGKDALKQLLGAATQRRIARKSPPLVNRSV